MKNRKALIFLSGVLVLLAVLWYLMARPLMATLLFACLMAVGFSPMHERLARKLRWPSVAALLSTLVIYTVILAPLVFVAITVSEEIAAASVALREASEKDGGVAPYLRGRLAAVTDRVASRFQMEGERLAQEVTKRIEAGLEWLARHFATGLWTAASLVFHAAVAGVILFFFLRDGRAIRGAIIDLIPLEEEDSKRLLAVIRDAIYANLYGVIGVAAAQGGLTGIGLAIAGLPSPFTGSVIAAFLSMLPVVGPTLVWGPAAIWLAASGSYGMAIFLTVWGVVVVGLVDNLLRPVLVGSKTHQHPMLVFAAILGGLSAFGMMGLFLGPLLISVTAAVFSVFRREAAREIHK